MKNKILLTIFAIILSVMTFATPKTFNGFIGNKKVVFVIDFKEHTGHYYYKSKSKEKHYFSIYFGRVYSKSEGRENLERETWYFDNEREKHKFMGDVDRSKNQVRGSFNKNTMFTINIK